jgi:ankyrin repeat protein
LIFGATSPSSGFAPPKSDTDINRPQHNVHAKKELGIRYRVANNMVLRKDQIEAALHAEHQEISAGRLKEDNPLDTSEAFRVLCEGSRRGDLKVVHEKIAEGVNINARDYFDYTPLILVIHSFP